MCFKDKGPFGLAHTHLHEGICPNLVVAKEGQDVGVWVIQA